MRQLKQDIRATEKAQSVTCLLHAHEAVFYVRTHTEGRVLRTVPVTPALGDRPSGTWSIVQFQNRALSLEKDEGGGPGVEWNHVRGPDGYWRQVVPPALSGALGSSGLSQKPQLPAWKVTLELVTWI